jgi:hypothetical protein
VSLKPSISGLLAFIPVSLGCAIRRGEIGMLFIAVLIGAIIALGR